MFQESRGERLYEILRLVRPMTHASARVVEATLRQQDVTVGMRAVMEVLDARGPATVPQIARTLDLARQGVQRLTDELTGIGYVRMLPNPRHRRSRLAELTPAGERAFAAIRDDERQQLGAMASACTDIEIQTATKVLSALYEDIRLRARHLDQNEEPIE